MITQKINFSHIASAALAQSESLIRQWLPDGKRHGDEWIALNPTRSDASAGSFKVNLTSGKWADFATDAQGRDLISLYGLLHGGLKNGQAAHGLAKLLGIETQSKGSGSQSKGSGSDARIVLPVPGSAPEPPTRHFQLGTPATTWEYRDADGQLLTLRYRFNLPDGGKEFRPLTLWVDSDTGQMLWKWKSIEGQRPLYGLDRLANRPDAPVLVCEGEKAADAAQRLLPEFVATTSLDGAKSPQKTDWTPIAGRDLVIWPDFDDPGSRYAKAVARLATQAGARAIRIMDLSGLLSPRDQGFDAADAERVGWTLERIQALVDLAVDAKPGPEATDSVESVGFGFETFGAFNPTGPVCIATDEKSAACINEHSHIAVVVAGSATGLWKAAQALRKAYPKAKILVCGDDAPEVADKARIAAFSLIGGSYWCNPDFLKPTRSEIEVMAVSLMTHPPKPGEEIHRKYIADAEDALKARDSQRIAEESPTTFADLAGWESGAERIAQQIKAAIANIGVIKIRPGKLPSIVDRAEKETLFFGADFYQRAGMLVRPVKQDVSTDGSVRIPAGALVLTMVNTSWLNRRFSQAAQWVKFNKEAKGWLPADPPTKYADTLLAMAGEWRAPVLTGIVECPTLRRDGSLLNQSGYDPESGLFVDYSGDPISVPDAPTRANALEALAVLKEPFAEFPFAEGDIDLAVALSGLLTAIVRRSLRTAPLFAFDAPVMGAGKGLIVNTIATVATGRAAPAISQGKDEAEDEKRLGALLLQGVPLLNIDNIERDLQGDLLCSALTETTIAIRILGKSEVPYMPSNVAVFATGNNLRARGDMVRRMLVCRIDPACERPDARSFKRNLNKWLPANRARLLSAALTVLRAYIVAGRPKQDIPPYGSFEEWSDLVRSSLVWLGMPDPNLTRARLEAEDAVTINLHSILTMWFAAFGKDGMTAAEVATQAGLPGNVDLHTALLEVAVSRRDSEKVDAFRLGHWLKKQKGKVANGLRLEKAGEDSHSKLLFWRVVNLQSAKSAGNAGIAGKDLSETRKNCKTSINVSESNFSRDWREVNPQYPHYPQNAPPEPDFAEKFSVHADALSSHHPVETPLAPPKCVWDRWNDRLVMKCDAPEPNADRTGCANCGALKAGPAGAGAPAHGMTAHEEITP